MMTESKGARLAVPLGPIFPTASLLSPRIVSRVTIHV
jgi:hypothetical protein